MSDMPLPDPFPCPVCGESGITVNADILINLATMEPVHGADCYLAESARWNCDGCKSYGPVKSDGPWFYKNMNYGAGVSQQLLNQRWI